VRHIQGGASASTHRRGVVSMGTTRDHSEGIAGFNFPLLFQDSGEDFQATISFPANTWSIPDACDANMEYLVVLNHFPFRTPICMAASNRTPFMLYIISLSI
jgi:hypothetical protein